MYYHYEIKVLSWVQYFYMTSSGINRYIYLYSMSIQYAHKLHLLIQFSKNKIIFDISVWYYFLSLILHHLIFTFKISEIHISFVLFTMSFERFSWRGKSCRTQVVSISNNLKRNGKRWLKCIIIIK